MARRASSLSFDEADPNESVEADPAESVKRTLPSP
jgi:hypothetical protein